MGEVLQACSARLGEAESLVFYVHEYRASQARRNSTVDQRGQMMSLDDGYPLPPEGSV
jgi:hypothetical protein